MSLNGVSGLTPSFTTPSIPIPPPVSQARTSPALYPATTTNLGTSGAFALYPSASSGTSGGGQIADTIGAGVSVGMNRFSPTLAGAVASGIVTGAGQGVPNPYSGFRQNGGLSQK